VEGTTTMIISGLDIGQTKDSMAFVCLRRFALTKPTPKRRWRYECAHLETWPLGTNYVVVADALTARYEAPQLRSTPLAPDFGGVGRPVFNLLQSKRIKARMTPVLSTSGKMRRYDEANKAWNVPKIELVSTLQVLLQGEYLVIDPRLKYAPRLKRELQEYRETITRSKNQTFSASNSQHDDLVSGLMLACWYGEQSADGFAESIGFATEERRAVSAQAPEGVNAFEGFGLRDAPNGVFNG
jgi:hypothetical protein